MCADHESLLEGSEEPPEDRLLDQLFEAFSAGDPVETARVLRLLPELERTDLCAFAELFDGGSPDEPRWYFGQRLIYVRPAKGRPKARAPDWRRDHGIIAFVKDRLDEGTLQKNAIKMAAEKFDVGVTKVRNTLKKNRYKTSTT